LEQIKVEHALNHLGCLLQPSAHASPQGRFLTLIVTAGYTVQASSTRHPKCWSNSEVFRRLIRGAHAKDTLPERFLRGSQDV
jgi:hypothetical protein